MPPPSEQRPSRFALVCTLFLLLTLLSSRTGKAEAPASDQMWWTGMDTGGRAIYTQVLEGLKVVRAPLAPGNLGGEVGEAILQNQKVFEGVDTLFSHFGDTLSLIDVAKKALYEGNIGGATYSTLKTGLEKLLLSEPIKLLAEKYALGASFGPLGVGLVAAIDFAWETSNWAAQTKVEVEQEVFHGWVWNNLRRRDSKWESSAEGQHRRPGETIIEHDQRAILTFYLEIIQSPDGVVGKEFTRLYPDWQTWFHNNQVSKIQDKIRVLLLQLNAEILAQQMEVQLRQENAKVLKELERLETIMRNTLPQMDDPVAVQEMKIALLKKRGEYFKEAKQNFPEFESKKQMVEGALAFAESLPGQVDQIGRKLNRTDGTENYYRGVKAEAQTLLDDIDKHGTLVKFIPQRDHPYSALRNDVLQLFSTVEQDIDRILYRNQVLLAYSIGRPEPGSPKPEAPQSGPEPPPDDLPPDAPARPPTPTKPEAPPAITDCGDLYPLYDETGVLWKCVPDCPPGAPRFLITNEVGREIGLNCGDETPPENTPPETPPAEGPPTDGPPSDEPPIKPPIFTPYEYKPPKPFSLPGFELPEFTLPEYDAPEMYIAGSDNEWKESGETVSWCYIIQLQALANRRDLKQQLLAIHSQLTSQAQSLVSKASSLGIPFQKEGGTAQFAEAWNFDRTAAYKEASCQAMNEAIFAYHQSWPGGLGWHISLEAISQAVRPDGMEFPVRQWDLDRLNAEIARLDALNLNETRSQATAKIGTIKDLESFHLTVQKYRDTYQKNEKWLKVIDEEWQCLMQTKVPVKYIITSTDTVAHATDCAQVIDLAGELLAYRKQLVAVRARIIADQGGIADQLTPITSRLTTLARRVDELEQKIEKVYSGDFGKAPANEKRAVALELGKSTGTGPPPDLWNRMRQDLFAIAILIQQPNLNELKGKLATAPTVASVAEAFSLYQRVKSRVDTISIAFSFEELGMGLKTGPPPGSGHSPPPGGPAPYPAGDAQPPTGSVPPQMIGAPPASAAGRDLSPLTPAGPPSFQPPDTSTGPPPGQQAGFPMPPMIPPQPALQAMMIPPPPAMKKPFPEDTTNQPPASMPPPPKSQTIQASPPEQPSFAPTPEYQPEESQEPILLANLPPELPGMEPAFPEEKDSPAVSPEERITQIRQLYQQFSQYYTMRDMNGLLSLLSLDWTSSNGDDVAEMESVLDNSFMVFDQIQYSISGLRIKALEDGTYEASYTSRIIGTISDQGIRHQEEASVTDIVGDQEGKMLILRTNSGRYW